MLECEHVLLVKIVRGGGQSSKWCNHWQKCRSWSLGPDQQRYPGRCYSSWSSLSDNHKQPKYSKQLKKLKQLQPLPRYLIKRVINTEKEVLVA